MSQSVKSQNPPAGRVVSHARSRSEGIHVRRGIGLIGMTLLAPGSAQLAAGNKTVGRIAMRVWGSLITAVLLLAVLFLVARGAVVALVTTAWVLKVAMVLVVVLGIGWALLLLDAVRLARPGGMGRRRGGVLAAVSLALAAVMAAGAIGVGSSVNAQANLLGSVFGGGGHTKEVNGRYNILLLGADAGKSRWGLRPDSITVASVDADTGRTVLFSLPRNMEQVPFPETSPLHKLYPNGYDCESHECMLNAVYTLGLQNKELYPGVKNPGVVATREAVEAILGLKINYYAMVDLKGFEALIDAVGGITLDVNKKVPIGGGTSPIYGYVGPGRNLHLDGFHALWFARSREGSNDYERMVRQKCVMNAMLNQLDPWTVLTKFNDIAAAGKEIVATDVPPAQANALMELAQKAKSKKVSSVSFAPPLIYPGTPDYPLLRKTVQDKIAAAEAADKAKRKPKTKATSATPAQTPGAAPSSGAAAPSASASPTIDRTTDDLGALCSAS